MQENHSVLLLKNWTAQQHYVRAIFKNKIINKKQNVALNKLLKDMCL